MEVLPLRVYDCVCVRMYIQENQTKNIMKPFAHTKIAQNYPSTKDTFLIRTLSL